MSRTTVPGEGYYEEEFQLTAGQCGAEGRMPVTLMVSRAIEVATAHANRLGIGYDELKKQSLAWVLSRMSVEVTRYPGINERYSVRTWIEGWSRRFSERNFIFYDAQKRPLAYVRSVWMAIDIKNHTMGDLGKLGDLDIAVAGEGIDMAKTPKITEPEDSHPSVREYVFQYCDIDFNRHVNSVKYLEAILNGWPLERFDRMSVKRLDVAYMAECRFGEKAEIKTWNHGAVDGECSVCAIERDGHRAVAVKLLWQDPGKNQPF